jgi:membrane-bound ClpP family serine protease
MDVVLIIGLIILGIFFMAVEVFLIPGTTLAGVASVACFIVGIVLAYNTLGNVAGSLILAGSMILLGVVLYVFFRSKTLDRMALKSEIKSKTDPFKGLDVQPGDTGVTISRLGPIGRVKINGKTIEGRSENEMIDQNTPVQVIEVGTYNVLVRKIQSS